MAKLKIRSKDLKEMVYFRLDKRMDEDLLEEELDEITDITLKGNNIIGEKTDINLSELEYFKNIQSCIISGFILDDKLIKILNNMKNLDNLQFTKCDFKNVKNKLNANINYLILDTCQNFTFYTFNNNTTMEILRIINRNIDMEELKEFNSIKKLYLQNCNIIHLSQIEKLENIKYFNLERSRIDNNEVLNKIYKKMKIVI